MVYKIAKYRAFAWKDSTKSKRVFDSVSVTCMNRNKEVFFFWNDYYVGR